MTRWVRLWEDMPTDPKWRAIARKSGRSISEVIAVFNFMMVCAANYERTQTNANERGELIGWDDDDIGSALDMDGQDVQKIRTAMDGKVLDNMKLRGWENRQPLREDGSAERAKQWRERKRTQENAPETDTESERKKESKLSKKRLDRLLLGKKLEFEKELFERFWEAYGYKQQRKRAEQAFEKSITKASIETILEGVSRYHSTRPVWQEFALAASWLNGERWMDQPAIAGKINGHAGPAKVPGVPLVFVAEDSPQWEAWEAFYRTTKGTSPPKTNRGHTFERGWHFPTEWPPEEPKHDPT